MHVDAVAQCQRGVRQHQIRELASLAVDLDEPLAALPVVRVAAVVIACHERHVDRDPGEVSQSVVERAEGHSADNRRGVE